MSAPGTADIARVAAAVRAARRVLFVTGAGVSAESGLPTYRGVGGLYEGTETEDGVPIEVALSGAMMETRPALSWKHIARIEAACRGVQPNRAHAVIAALGAREAGREVVVLTQNVDGLHRVAGTPDDRLIEIHGDVHELYCPRCGWRTRVDSFAAFTTIPPPCPRASCAGVVRPDVVLFGELLPRRAVDRLAHELARGFDVVFAVGTTAAFPYIADAVLAPGRRGALTVEVNPGETPLSDRVAVRLRSPAAVTLAAVMLAVAVRGTVETA